MSNRLYRKKGNTHNESIYNYVNETETRESSTKFRGQGRASIVPRSVVFYLTAFLNLKLYKDSKSNGKE